MTTNGFIPSHFQEAVFQFVGNRNGGSRHGIVNAVAGSGKTETLVRSAGLISEQGMFCAFNKHIADKLARRLDGTGMMATTIHSVGLRTLTRSLRSKPTVDENKYWTLVREYVRTTATLRSVPYVVPRLVKLVRFARLTLAEYKDTADLKGMAVRYSLEHDDAMLPAVRPIVERGILQAKNGTIDFTDMLSLPHYFDLKPPTFRWVMVDECQDLNRAQLELVMKSLAPGGRSLWVGDPNQSIMAFAGADTRSYQSIMIRTNAKELPLSICYRCPRKVISMAKEIVPQIEAAPNAPIGAVRYHSDESAVYRAEQNDLIMCRKNAPLVKHCLRLVSQGVQARVRGRDIGKELATMALEIGQSVPYAKFLDALESYQDSQAVMLTAAGARDEQFEALADRCDALRECYRGFSSCRSADEMAGKLESIFADSGAAVWFSSIHRAKGLEAERTWILNFGRLGEGASNASAEERQQETNLRYVAITRAQNTMNLIFERG